MSGQVRVPERPTPTRPKMMLSLAEDLVDHLWREELVGGSEPQMLRGAFQHLVGVSDPDVVLFVPDNTRGTERSRCCSVRAR